MRNKVKFNKGVFTLSLDTELAWGMIDKPHSLINNREYFYNTRKAIDGIIELLEKYEISATWAIVGSLLLDRPTFEKKFVEYITKDLEDGVKKKYLDLLDQKEIWCGKDILNKIKATSVPQEIGSHSFTHVIFGDHSVTKEKASEEFTESFEILRQLGEPPVSFVFPRNSINYLEELRASGFKAYRGVEPSWYINVPGKMKKIFHVLDQMLAITPPVVTPIYNDNLVNIPASMLYLPMNGFRKYIPLRSRIKKAYKGIQKAIDEKKIFHLWFHPFNIATNQKELLKGLEKIFMKVNEERYNGNMDVMTMKQIVAKLEI